MLNGNATVHALRAAGVSLVVDLTGALPRVLHWGADLGPLDPATAAALRATSAPAVLNNSPDVPRAYSVWPTEQDGWAGTPAQAGNRGGTATTPRPRLVDAAVEHDAEGGRIALQLDDVVAGTRARVEYRLDAAGVLSADLSIENDSDAASAGPYMVDGLRALLPLPGSRDRAARLHRQVVPRTRTTASALRLRHPRASRAPRQTRARLALPAGSGHRGIRLRHTARSGGCTSRGAATASTSPNGCPRAPASSRA